MAAVVAVGLVARHLYSARALPYTLTLWAAVSSFPGSWEGEKGMKVEGSWLVLLFPHSFRGSNSLFGASESVLVAYFPTTHLKQWHSWKVELGEAAVSFSPSP